MLITIQSRKERRARAGSQFIDTGFRGGKIAADAAVDIINGRWRGDAGLSLNGCRARIRRQLKTGGCADIPSHCAT